MTDRLDPKHAQLRTGEEEPTKTLSEASMVGPKHDIPKARDAKPNL